jgi:hypothetical protein
MDAGPRARVLRALAARGRPRPGSGGAPGPGGRGSRLDEAHAELQDARRRVEAAQDAYADWRQRKYPRGVRKEKLVQEVADAEVALAEAQAAWQAIQEDARRAGVPPGVLRDYE